MEVHSEWREVFGSDNHQMSSIDLLSPPSLEFAFTLGGELSRNNSQISDGTGLRDRASDLLFMLRSLFDLEVSPGGGAPPQTTAVSGAKANNGSGAAAGNTADIDHKASEGEKFAADS